jgi:hypothetical protein
MANTYDAIETFLADERWLAESPTSLTPNLPSLIQSREQTEAVNGQTLAAISLLNQFPNMPRNVPLTKQTISLEQERTISSPVANSRN